MNSAMTRTRITALGLAAVLAVAGVVVPGTAAAAAPHVAQTATQAASAENPEIVTERDTDGTLLVRLGGPMTSADELLVDGSLLGQVVVVPGDSGQASVRVRNEGPTSGTLAVSIVNAVPLRDTSDESWIDDAFFDDLTINGVPASSLEGNRTVIHEVELAEGATVDVPVTYGFPVDATSGNRAFAGSRVFTFDVLLRIVGDTTHDGGLAGSGASGGDSATGQGDVGPDDGAASEGDTASPDAGLVTHTGGATLPDGVPWLLLLAAMLMVVAASAARAVRRSPAEQGEGRRL